MSINASVWFDGNMSGDKEDHARDNDGNLASESFRHTGCSGSGEEIEAFHGDYF